jgi:hypothetical protein
MVFLPNIPQPGDFLDDSQNDLLNNNMQLDASFGVDHYAFSNGTSYNGFHNQITSPLIVGGVHPTTAVGIPKIYAMQDSANAGVLHYSRGPNDAVPTPLTTLQSQASPITLNNGSNLTIFNFTGLSRSIAMLYAIDYETINVVYPYIFSLVMWNGTAIVSKDISASAAFSTVSSGSNLIIQNATGTNMTQLFWTLQFLRMQ